MVSSLIGVQGLERSLVRRRRTARLRRTTEVVHAVQDLTFAVEAATLVAAVAAAYDVADLSIQEPDIEDVIRELYSTPPG